MTQAGFEPAISGLRGRRPCQLDHWAICLDRPVAAFRPWPGGRGLSHVNLTTLYGVICQLCFTPSSRNRCTI